MGNLRENTSKDWSRTGNGRKEVSSFRERTLKREVIS